ncbi:MAG: hypothetical protein AB1650_02615 [Candidatus Omnitrophota bacterium]
MRDIRKYWLTAIAVIAAAAFLSCEQNIPREIEVHIDGKTVQIKSGQHCLNAELTGEEDTETFVLVGGSGRGFFPFTAHFSVLSISTIQRLKREFGDSVNLDMRGSLESKARPVSMFLYASNPTVAQTLDDADDLAMSWNYPVIKIRYAEIKILEHSAVFFGHDVPVRGSYDYKPNFLVTSAVLISPQFSEEGKY